MEMLSGFREGAPTGYVRGGAILDTNDSDAESDASGQGVFDYSAEVVSVASSVDSASMKKKNNHESGRKSDRSKKKMRPRQGAWTKSQCAVSLASVLRRHVSHHMHFPI